ATLFGCVDVAVGATENVLLNVAGLVGCVNVILCDAFAALTVRTTSVAAEKLPLPACEAVRVQSVVPLVIVTVPAEIEQPPDATTETFQPKLLVALTGKVVPNVAGLAGWPKVMVCEPFARVTVTDADVAAL